MFGFLNINKPPGKTSRDAVNHVQRIVRPEKAGHAGTLDPLASGVLVVAVGRATRLIEYVQRASKRYRAEFLLGRESNTEDVEGEVVELADPPRPSREEIERALPDFTGRISQRPPAYSALKVGGKRAYALARGGQQVELVPRPVTVHSIAVAGYDYPRLQLDVQCGAGTYMRSLGRDIANSLGTSAVMSALVRKAVGEFDLQDACELDQLTVDSLREQLLPPLIAVANLPRVQLEAAQQVHLRHGRTISGAGVSEAKEIAAVDADGNLIAILGKQGDLLRPIKNLGD